MSGKVRVPRQQRSIQKKEQILTTALSLFCTNGYHKTTTNQIAKEASLSIGTLYEYFGNKEAILSAILEQYMGGFVDTDAFVEEFRRLNDIEDKEKWCYDTLKAQVVLHQKSKDFNMELQALYFSLPQVTEICDSQKAVLHTILVKALSSIRESLCITDLDAGAYVLMDMLDSVIDRIVFYKHDTCSDEQILKEGAAAIKRYLFG